MSRVGWSDWGTCRTLLKFKQKNVLTNHNIKAKGQIISASIEMRDLMCQSDEVPVYCTQFAGKGGTYYEKITALLSFLFILSLSVLLSSCSQSNEYSSDSTESQYEFEDKYDVVLYGKYLTTDIADINKPEQLVDDSHNSGFDPDSVQKIDFLGKIYNVKYDNDKHANGVYDYYLYGYSVTDINSDVWKFALSSDGGKFAYAVMLGEDIETLSDAGTEKRTEKVKKFAESLIDLGKYRFDGEEKTVLGTHYYEGSEPFDEIRYEYRYIRYSGEVKPMKCYIF